MGECPAAKVSVQWAGWWRVHLLWPLGVQLLLTLLFRGVVRRVYDNKYHNDPRFKRFVNSYVGNHNEHEVTRPKVLIVLYAAQILSSGVAVTCWVLCTYWQQSLDEIRALLLLMAGVDFLNWAVNRLRGECTAACLWEANAIVDVLTVVPALHCALTPEACTAGEDWLSLHFLRSYSLPFCFRRIRDTGVLRLHSRGRLEILELWLKACCLLFVMAGTIFTCEILGDPPALRDSCLTTPHGDPVSMAQMVYWIVVSITTVGYGDWAPRTMLSRILTCLFIVYGIATIFVIQFSFSDLWSRYLEGSGSYQPWTGVQVPHVVVILGVRGRASQLSTVLSGFLLEVLHPSHQRGALEWPNVVVFSPSLWEGKREGALDDGGGHTFEGFLRRLGLSSEARSRVWFVVGRATSKVDMERAGIASSSLTFVLTDMNSDFPDEDDAQNIFTAMMVQQAFPKLQLRVLLVRPESKNLAVQSGVDATCCFSSRELKAHLLAQSVRCHGILPILAGLFKSWDMIDVEQFLSNANAKRPTSPIKRKWTQRELRHSCSMNSASIDVHHMAMMFEKHNVQGWEEMANRAWMYHYFQGLEQNIYGFQLAESYDGQTYGQVASAIYACSGAVLVGVYSAGVLVCPQPSQLKHVRGGQLCFAVARTCSQLDPVRLGCGASWQHTFARMRQRVAREVARKGVHLAAARVMGQQLRRRVEKLRSNSGQAISQRASVTSIPNSPHADNIALSATSTAMRRDFSLHEPIPETEGLGAALPEQRCSARIDSFAIAPIATDGGQLNGPRGPQTPQELRARLSKEDELVVVIVCNGEVWQQVKTLVQGLLASYQPFDRPVIILAPTAPAASFLEHFEDRRVVAMTGSCLSAEALVEAGVLDARAVVVMSGQIPKEGRLRESFFRDYQAVLCSQELECWCGCSPREIFTIYELQESRSVNHLPLEMKRRKADLRTAIEEAFEDTSDSDVSYECEPAPRQGLGVTRGHHSVARVRPKVEQKLDKLDISATGTRESVCLNSRFAAGQVFSPELFGAMLGRMFYMPVIIELVEALLMPHQRHQRTFFWQMRTPPEYVHRIFGELFQDLATGVWGRGRRTSAGDLSVEEEEESTGGGEGQLPPPGETVDAGHGPAVLVAVYRSRDVGSDTNASGTGSRNYSILAPEPNFELNEEDWLTVLASQQFGETVHSLGLLRGTC